GTFSEGREESGEAVLVLDEATQVGKLEYSGNVGLVLRRTARRQAESICKAGFLLGSGKRVGENFRLETDEDRIDDRLKQTGHKYR
ncbi:MAG: hypothetical protein ACXAB2_12200, partial [Candidatus Hodarchaeales archaeon]